MRSEKEIKEQSCLVMAEIRLAFGAGGFAALSVLSVLAAMPEGRSAFSPFTNPMKN